MYKKGIVESRMEGNEMNTNEYCHRLLLLIHIMISLFTPSGCNGKRKIIFFLIQLCYSHFFPMVLHSLQEVSKSTLTLPPS